MLHKNVIHTFILAISLGSPISNADTLYGNLSEETSGWDSLSSWGPLANSFSVGSSDFTLTGLQVLIYGEKTSTGAFSVSLLTDNNSTPGTLFSALNTFSDLLLPSQSNVFDITFNQITLSANTKYWIELFGADTSANWAWTSAALTNPEYFSNIDGVFSSSDGPYQMAVYGTPVSSTLSSVPIPSAIWLMASALLGITSFSIRRAS